MTIKEFKIKFRPSGHSRICMNTIVYIYFLTERWNTDEKIEFWQWNLVHIHCSVLFTMAFVSNIAYHTLDESIVGQLLGLPQIALMIAMESFFAS